MVLYRYVKKTKNKSAIRQPADQPVERREIKNSHRKFLPTALIIVGLGLLINVAYPVLNYHFFATFRFQPKLLSPLAESIDMVDHQVLSQTQDLTLLSNWFPETSEPATRPSSKVTHYTISIPFLKIFEAAVEIGGEDLKESLIHYGGTTLPGEFGNTVIFGHSVLPQFFNPKNYLTIFSTLPELSENDEVFVNFDGIEYKYKVYKMVEVDPDDVVILEQQYDDSYLTLVTCVPPGTYWKRLAVKARLEKI